MDDGPVVFDGPVTVRGTYAHSPPPPEGDEQPPGPHLGISVREPHDPVTHDLYIVDVAGHDVALEIPVGYRYGPGDRLHVAATLTCSRARTLAFSDGTIRPLGPERRP